MAFLCRNAHEGLVIEMEIFGLGENPTVPRLPRDRTLGLAITYRAKGSECAQSAAQARDPESKHILEKTAEQWKALADGIEKYEAKIGLPL
jgi:hypothetical protein